uniref:B30.2/SPRY domain-containing protein n=1 Tax=Cyprinus carpio TaxID=7962 RepID=A0A8C1X7P6_CYPCA
MLKKAGPQIQCQVKPPLFTYCFRLSGCMVTEEGCCYLSSALNSNPSHLRELDLSYNHPGESGVRLLSDLLNHPNCTLDKLNVDHGGEFRITAGLHKYFCDLTMDPDTANTKLILSEENRKVTYVDEDQPYPDHPERFNKRPHVLCREHLSGRCYWEAEWSGQADISVTYKGICRKGKGAECVFGFNEISWCLICSDEPFALWSDYRHIDTRITSGSCRKVGVYVDISAGTLSFYSISDTHTLTHIYTFNTTFTDTPYVGFGFMIHDLNSTLTLCQSETFANNATDVTSE